jgi:D-erythronate 2-dehydrogenase
VVSAAAEADFDLGMRVNLEGTRLLLEAARQKGNRPRFVFASSCAVYGGELPPTITDETHLTPQSSYGAQKAASELLVNDHGRKGFLDSRSLRLPTIVVRPGRPNKAASTFASSIVREPLNGEEAVCPVSRETAMYVLSPRRVVDAFIRAMELPAEALGSNRTLLLPGLTMTVAEMVEALERVAGAKVASRIRFERDPQIERIVHSWPARFAAERARGLGFERDSDLQEIIRQHIEDERGGRWVE